MVADGHPYRRRQPDANKDILSGVDFLSILMDSSAGRTTPNPSQATVIEIKDYVVNVDTKNHVPPYRSTSPFAQTTTEQLAVSNRISDSSDKSNNGVIIAVRISSSVGTDSHEQQDSSNNSLDEITSSELTTFLPMTDITSRNFIVEQLPIVVAKSSKSELIVEEGEPITKNNPSSTEYEDSYPAKVEPLPSQSYDPTADFLNQEFTKSSKQPVHHTVIYHDQTEDTKGPARSVSYSSIIQTLAQTSAEADKPVQHDRRERTYHGALASFVNNFSLNNERRKNDTRTQLAETRSSFSPRTSPVTESWQASTKIQENAVTTKRNRELDDEKPHVPPSPKPQLLPKLYSRAEQNYEVDEAVSVETNGRVHGIQPNMPPRSDKKHDDNQKVGYVVEGRNYRKYRVEERTADGFIVGEYGVVNHDDGILRGVRYTADGTISPRLISETLMKFLSL